MRAASIARRIYLNGGIGVGALATWYGGAKSIKSRPEHFRKASRGLIRHILRNLEEAGLVEQTEKGGRRVTAEGQKGAWTRATTRELRGAAAACQRSRALRRRLLRRP